MYAERDEASASPACLRGHIRATASATLATTDANLKQLAAHPLNTTQQDSVSQIRKYMEQAKAAIAQARARGPTVRIADIMGMVPWRFEEHRLRYTEGLRLAGLPE